MERMVLTLPESNVSRPISKNQQNSLVAKDHGSNRHFLFGQGVELVHVVLLYSWREKRQSKQQVRGSSPCRGATFLGIWVMM